MYILSGKVSGFCQDRGEVSADNSRADDIIVLEDRRGVKNLSAMLAMFRRQLAWISASTLLN